MLVSKKMSVKDFAGYVIFQILGGIAAAGLLGVTSEEKYSSVAGLAIGGALTFVHIIGIPLTGTSVSPARSLGPAIFAGGEALSQVWVFIVGPLVGAVLAAIVWKLISGKKEA